MTPTDWIVIGVIVLVIGGAVAYIIKAKKSGKKCIGCPDSGSCGGSCGTKSESASSACTSCGSCTSCSSCSSCSGCQSKPEEENKN